ncbi:TetR family transcriptional regulator [Bauldia sp.]|uniref:TetR family transcriptional regulator n=1 Tax=Bauldia sp. TaxID=2575872 RepID=UPI003BA955EE
MVNSGEKELMRAEPAAPSPRKTAHRPRNPERTKRDILVAARAEFCDYGLDGARVDRIAERAAANKRLLYHYFGNKEALYSAVLLEAYREIRAGEQKLALEALEPEDAMRELVRFTFDHFRKNPWFVRLLSTENMLHAEYLKRIPEIPKLHSPIVEQLGEVLAAGQREGVFRKGVDPVQLYISIASLSYFYFSNLNTLSVIFKVPLKSRKQMTARRDHAEDVVLGYLRA